MCPRRSSDCSIAEFELNYRTGSGSDVAVLVPLNESLCAAQRPGRYTARTDECVRVDLATAQLPNLSSTTEQEAVATWPFRNTQALVEWHRNGQVATASCSVVECSAVEYRFTLGRLEHCPHWTTVDCIQGRILVARYTISKSTFTCGWSSVIST